jgi:hypothetical protein
LALPAGLLQAMVIESVCSNQRSTNRLIACQPVGLDRLTDTYGKAVDYLVGKAGLRPAVIDEMCKNMLE